MKPSSASVFVVALVLAACITACGGGSSAEPVFPSTPANLRPAQPTPEDPAAAPAKTLQISGKVMGSTYLAETVVCADLNGNGQCDPGEPKTATDAAGQYGLDVPTGYRGINLLALVQPNANTANTANTGWTLAAPLEYDDAATRWQTHITPLTSVYAARLRVQGRNRLNNQIAVFTRIVFEPNIDPGSNRLILPIDFDLVANPRNALIERITALDQVLIQQSQALAQPLDWLHTAAQLHAWYSTYTAPTATAPGLPADAKKISALAANDPNSAASFIANDFHNFRPNADAALRFRQGITDTAGWLRSPGQGALSRLDRRSVTLGSGGIVDKISRWEQGVWSPLSLDEGDYLTLNASAAQAAMPLLPRPSPTSMAIA
jgi:hypothetical protein